MKRALPIIIILVIIAGTGFAWKQLSKEPIPLVTNFEECVIAGNPVMESYPRQCRHEGETFIEDIGNELGKTDLIRLDSPRPNQVIKSPLTIEGEARGNWFFEASFPVVLTDWDGRIIAEGIATAKSEWMTTEFVPFDAKLTFSVDKNAYSNRGSLILRKDNPSGLPEHDDALEIPVLFAEVKTSVLPTPKACTAEAKLCPDGSAVGRSGPNCEFATCPLTEISCLNDSDCAGGNVCHKNNCIAPIGNICTGPDDTSCPLDFECSKGCGPPVVRYPDDMLPPYICQIKGYTRNCPICLAKNTLIGTPLGLVAVQNLQKGDSVWTVNNSGERVQSIIIETSKTPVPEGHKMVKLTLHDGRTVLVSPGHPTIDGSIVGDIKEADMYDGAVVFSAEKIPYGELFTYDILPSGETGFYFANDILLDSTLRNQ